MQIRIDSADFIDYKMAMIKLNIHEAKTHLSRYLKLVGKGETIILCKRNIPIAEIRPLAPPRKTPRPIGLAGGRFQLLPEFFKSLPSELTGSFDGDLS